MKIKFWKRYEIKVFNHLKTLFPDANIIYDRRVKGVKSLGPRQIDILIDEHVAGHNFRIVYDCKYYNKRVDVKEVESFISFLEDVEADRGFLITNKGYTEGAQNRISHEKSIELHVLPYKVLESKALAKMSENSPAGPGGIIHRDNHGLIVTAPQGWLLEAPPQGLLHSVLCFLYPVSSDLNQSLRMQTYAYVNIVAKSKDKYTIKKLLREQQINTRKKYLEPKITVESISGQRYTFLRTILYTEHTRPELTAFFDFDDFLAYIVLYLPNNRVEYGKGIINEIADKLILLNVNHMRPPK